MLFPIEFGNILRHKVAERQKRIREMYVLDYGAAFGCGKLHVREVPDRIYAVAGKQLGNGDCVLLGNAKHRNVNMILVQKLRQLVDVMHHDAVMLVADKLRLDVERRHKLKAPLVEGKVAHERLTDIADADKYSLKYRISLGSGQLWRS